MEQDGAYLAGFMTTLLLDTAPHMAFLVRSNAFSLAPCSNDDKPSKRPVKTLCASMPPSSCTSEFPCKNGSVNQCTLKFKPPGGRKIHHVDLRVD